jgi:uncharacterized membrane protein YGL010W
MICPPHAPAPVVEDWLARHRHPGSFLLHLIGIPMSLAGFLLTPFFLGLLSLPMFLFALGLFVGGYLLQFLGHLCEGSEPGEVARLRNWLRRRSRQPRVGVSGMSAGGSAG